MVPDAFYSDADYEACKAKMFEDLKPIAAALAAGRLVVFPADGLGTSRAQLPILAPRLHRLLEGTIRRLAEKHGCVELAAPVLLSFGAAWPLVTR